MDHPLLLVVEDEAILQIVLEDLLTDAGFALVMCSDAQAAFNELEHDAQRFVGLITDIRLPGKKSGWDIARRARELSLSIPVVYMTGDSSHEWTAQGVPGSILILKPFAEAQLTTAISQLLNQQPIACVGAQLG